MTKVTIIGEEVEKVLTAEEIAEKYVYVRHQALTDGQEIRDMVADINRLLGRGLKKIEFVHYLSNIKMFTPLLSPLEYDNIELINKGCTSYDVMFAYNNGERRVGVLYLGYFNDGVV